MSKLRLFAIALPIVLSACGGGGSSAPSAPSSLAYNGLTTPAAITTANQSALVGNVLGGANSSNIMTGVAVSGNAQKNSKAQFMALAKAARIAASQAQTGHTLANGVTVTIPASTVNGTAGGTMTMSGQIDDTTLAGTLNITFTNYSNGIVKMTGSVTMTITAWDMMNMVPSDSTLTFTNMQATDVSTNAVSRIDGSFRLQVNAATNTETMTINSILEDSLTAQQGKLVNFVIVNTYDNVSFPTTVSTVTTGRVYDSLYGYVDVTTTSPMVITNLNTDLYPSSGQIILSGANGTLGGATKVKATAILNMQVQLDVDVDGDNVYDNSVQVLWSSL